MQWAQMAASGGCGSAELPREIRTRRSQEGDLVVPGYGEIDAE